MHVIAHTNAHRGGIMFRSIHFARPQRILRLVFAALLAMLVMSTALPAGVYAQEGEEASALHSGQPANTTTYVVRRGDTLNAIARRHNTTVAAILASTAGWR